MEFYKAVKIVNGKYMSVRGNLEYRVGETYTVKGKVKLCFNGFHACNIAVHCWDGMFGYNVDTDAMLVVTLSGDVVEDTCKSAGQIMTVLRVLSSEEKFALSTGVLVNADRWTPCDRVDPVSRQQWYEAGKQSRADDLPAVILPGFVQEWWIGGALHRDGDKPAVVYAAGTQEWWTHGKRHRDGDKPARVGNNGTHEWWVDGERHRDGDLPAVIHANGYKVWWKAGKPSREDDKPVVVYDNGDMEWWKDGLRHRDGDKPAFMSAYGDRQWWTDGKCHRGDGQPAVINANGDSEWWVDGKCLGPLSRLKGKTG